MTIRIKLSLPIKSLLFRARMFEKQPNTNYRSRLESDKWLLASYDKFEYNFRYNLYRRDNGMYRIPNYISNYAKTLIEENS